jgi:DNA-binding IclR family transcriptional regulator
MTSSSSVDDEFIVVLTRMESREIMRSLTKVGGRVATVVSGVGKAVLATYSDEDVSAIIGHHAAIDGEFDRAAGRPVQGIDPAPGLRRRR